MPCSDTSSGMTIRFTADGRLEHYEFGKMTCARPIDAGTGFAGLCAGKHCEEILAIPFGAACEALNIGEFDDEALFILQLEFDAVKAAIAAYLGVEGPGIDHERCAVSSISCTGGCTEVAVVILPPKDLPVVRSCSSRCHCSI